MANGNIKNNPTFKSGTTSDMTGQVTFSEAFPDDNYSITLCPLNGATGLLWSFYVTSRTASGFTFEGKYFQNNQWWAYNQNVMWVASHP